MECGNEDNCEWGTISKSKDAGYRISAIGKNTGRVPNVMGMGAKDAVFLMQQCGLKVKVDGVGTVVSQSINAGTVAREGTTVRLQLDY